MFNDIEQKGVIQMEQKEIKIVIDIQDASSYSLTPYTVYRALCTEYQKNVENLHNCNFWGMGTACNTAARELYSHITGRPAYLARAA